MPNTYEIRDAIYGFIELNDWEREIINHPVFQRLRRIRQLSLTDMVYPGAMHTRFEHSLGVMHVATRMFDEIVKRRADFLKSELNYNVAGFERDRVIVKLAALLHDIGHAPFSHASEELMAKDPDSKKSFKHENYSAAAVIFKMRDVIENHPINANYSLKAEDIANFLNGRLNMERTLLWRNLVSSQLDADRADYLLRDSHHAGVAYGKYDLNRLLVTLTVSWNEDANAPTLAIEEGGEHAAEALIIARYMMFTQVYFQHTRRAYDYHAVQTIKRLLKKYQDEIETFPPPIKEEELDKYLEWDDWRVLGLVHRCEGGKHAAIIRERMHYRCIYQTHELPGIDEIKKVEEVIAELDEKRIPYFVDRATSSWYKLGENDILISEQPRGKARAKLIPLSRLSTIVGSMKPIEQTRIYVPVEKKDQARKLIKTLKEFE